MDEGYQPVAKILLVEDDRSLRLTQSLYLQRERFQVGTAADREEARRELAENTYDVVVTDLRLGEDDGLDVLRDVRKLQPGAEILVITAYGSVATAVAAMKEGAYDYLTKPTDPEYLVHTIRKALEYQRLSRQVTHLRHQVADQVGLDQVVAESPAMRRILATIEQVAASSAPVLIEGDSGTGKELVARLIHRHSPREPGPFLAINCGAMPENLLESELFGHVRGAFTGAHKDKKGLFESADGGTLLLDEVAETTPNFQVKLLRAIQERSIRRVGDTREIPVDVRIIAATNKNLAELAAEGRFRQDLFFRLKVIPITLPPLRDRPEDILPLAETRLAQFSNRMGRRTPGLTDRARKKLMEYQWPGNVRELENVLERALIFNKGDVIDDRDLVLESVLCRDPDGAAGPDGPPLSLVEMERRHILEVLDRCGGNQSQAARVLGIGYNTLWRKLKKYGIKP